jgi:hypothetical protein|tara:strand:- start:234 stop:464 length:231 start_codon:yes stop_codon:yes gene_type:complete
VLIGKGYKMTKIKTRVAEFFSGTHEQLMSLLGSSKEVETEDLNNYTVTELKSMAKGRGLTGYSSLKKAELIDLLNN